MSHLNGAAKTSEIIGMAVKNYQGEKLGKVEDLALDLESGRIVQVILARGGFIGIGDTFTAVPPGALHHDTAQKVLHLDTNREQFKNAPKFEMTQWEGFSDSNHLAAVYGHYGEESTFHFVQWNAQPAEAQSPLAIHRERELNLTATGTEGENRVTGDRQSMIPEARLLRVRKASTLMGLTVKNLQDEKLGKVENILVDLAAGRVLAVIISSGGFLGLGDELSAVPAAALHYSADGANLQLDTSKEMLQQAPHFRANEWPDVTQPDYANGVYQAYRISPYFTTNTVALPDNTARNQRDRSGGTLTPLDQGGSATDLDTTARIRRAIMAGKELSVNAHNVKIITQDGHVTLRGPVNSDEEKRFIGELAGNIAQPVNVDNQIEVK